MGAPVSCRNNRLSERRGISSYIAGMVAVLGTAACASGGGTSSVPSPLSVTANNNGASGTTSNNSASSTSSSSGNSTAGSTTTSVGTTSGSSTSTSGSSATNVSSTSVGVPAAASFGPSPVATQFATTGGPTLNGASGSFPPPNTVFPALSSTLAVTSSGLSPVANGGANVTALSSSTTSATYQLSIPSVNVNTTVQVPAFATSNGLSYVALGTWQQPGASGALSSFTEVVFGYQTSPTSVPSTGSASFSGGVQGTVFTPGTPFVGTAVNGAAALSVNFASGSITGAFTQMQYVNPANPGSSTAPNYLPWNDVSVNAHIAAGSTQFSGSTAVTSTPQSPLSLKASATGYINGSFYGPSAQSLAGIWSLSDGTNSALGGIVANH